MPTSGTIPVEAVRAGICFAPDGGGQFVNKVIATSCDGPHQMEAFAAYELPDGDYPGNDELRRSTYDRCQDWFEDYVGIGFWDSRYDISAITPSPSTWADGDRSVVCVVVDVDGKALDAPARNSGV